ncbi:hypothetical protein FVE85_0836 [Porphyridium purpureum]|uniref:Uncharacterized protein n=1 Tax=Porphyridium purpureum TaxID=35688 RepID=A0A5J4Z339_PORPP|nr:hypothetical protein FVE85_0836 [Porphyridium purpureum]|eukprot:POR9050..scf208_2
MARQQAFVPSFAASASGGPCVSQHRLHRHRDANRCAAVVVRASAGGDAPVPPPAPVAVDGAKCPGCGREEGVKRGCDGSGRVVGGLGVVLKWWPIKAYRPCDELVKRKGNYKRAGQSLEEIAFGRETKK